MRGSAIQLRTAVCSAARDRKLGPLVRAHALVTAATQAARFDQSTSQAPRVVPAMMETKALFIDARKTKTVLRYNPVRRAITDFIQR